MQNAKNGWALVGSMTAIILCIAGIAYGWWIHTGYYLESFSPGQCTAKTTVAKSYGPYRANEVDLRSPLRSLDLRAK